MNILNSSELYSVEVYILWYVNFISVLKRRKTYMKILLILIRFFSDMSNKIIIVKDILKNITCHMNYPVNIISY